MLALDAHKNVLLLYTSHRKWLTNNLFFMNIILEIEMASASLHPTGIKKINIIYLYPFVSGPTKTDVLYVDESEYLIYSLIKFK